MTNIYLDSYENDFVEEHEEHEKHEKTRPTSTLRTRPGRNACVRGLPTVASCLSKCARLGLNPKGLTT